MLLILCLFRALNGLLVLYRIRLMSRVVNGLCTLLFSQQSLIAIERAGIVIVFLFNKFYSFRVDLDLYLEDNGIILKGLFSYEKILFDSRHNSVVLAIQICDLVLIRLQAADSEDGSLYILLGDGHFLESERSQLHLFFLKLQNCS